MTVAREFVSDSGSRMKMTAMASPEVSLITIGAFLESAVADMLNGCLVRLDSDTGPCQSVLNPVPTRIAL